MNSMQWWTHDVGKNLWLDGQAEVKKKGCFALHRWNWVIKCVFLCNQYILGRERIILLNLKVETTASLIL